MSATALLTALVGAAGPVTAGGHDPTRCRPDDPRVSIPGDFFLEACFDGTYLLVINRSELPLYVDLHGDLANAGKERAVPSAHYASNIAVQWASHLLAPDFQMKVQVGNGGGRISLGYADDTGRKYAMLNQAFVFAPSFTGAPDVVADWLTEADDAWLQYNGCLRDPSANFLKKSWCATTFVGDMLFASARFTVNGALTVVQVKQWIELLMQIAESGRDLSDLNEDLGKYYSAQQSLTVPAGLIDGSTTPPPPTTPAGESLSLSLSGSCDSSGGIITSTSRGFTPGGHYTIRAWYPNGSAYPLGSGSGGAVRSDGTIAWRWPCAGDPAGTYATEVIDDSTGRSTGRVSFTIASVTQTPTPTSSPQTWPEQQGSNGANTFTNPYNASGMGTNIAAMAWVEVSCKVYAPQIASANPDGYWYRIASAPWNNQYYAVANTFWNGDVPGQTPYIHNTDFSVPDC